MSHGAPLATSGLKASLSLACWGVEPLLTQSGVFPGRGRGCASQNNAMQGRFTGCLQVKLAKRMPSQAALTCMADKYGYDKELESGRATAMKYGKGTCLTVTNLFKQLGSGYSLWQRPHHACSPSGWVMHGWESEFLDNT